MTKRNEEHRTRPPADVDPLVEEVAAIRRRHTEEAGGTVKGYLAYVRERTTKMVADREKQRPAA